MATYVSACGCFAGESRRDRAGLSPARLAADSHASRFPCARRSAEIGATDTNPDGKDWGAVAHDRNYPTGASLVNLESASLVGAILGGGTDTVFYVDVAAFYVDVAAGGTVTPEAAVPGPITGAGLSGITAACGGLLAWWRRRVRKRA
jgi:hypothetical protein